MLYQIHSLTEMIVLRHALLIWFKTLLLRRIKMCFVDRFRTHGDCAAVLSWHHHNTNNTMTAPKLLTIFFFRATSSFSDVSPPQLYLKAASCSEKPLQLTLTWLSHHMSIQSQFNKPLSSLSCSEEQHTVLLKQTLDFHASVQMFLLLLD